MRDARTGQVTDLVKPPAGAAFGRVTSCGDGEFILTASPSQAGGYRLRADAAGRAGELAQPGILLAGECRDIAASPGGTVLAYAVWNMSPPPPRTAEAGLADLATGERRVTSVQPGVVRSLSLANDAQTLAFQLETRSDAASGVYVASAAASDWVAQGKLLVDPNGQPYHAISPVISADGQAVYLTVA